MDYDFPPHLSTDIELLRSSSESLPSLVQSPGPSLLPSALLSRFHLELLCFAFLGGMVFGKELEDVDGLLDRHEIRSDEEETSECDLDSGAVADSD